MALRDYQQIIELATLYEIRLKGGVSGMGDQIKPSIETIGGTVDIFVAQTLPVSPTTGMTIIEGGDDFVGNAAFEYLPRYLYITQAGGTTTSILLSGVEAVAVV